jgi:threonine dehydratase
VERIVAVSEAEIRAAMAHYFTDTHHVAEGAGAAALAALLRDREALRGRRVGVALSGCNVDASLYASVLQAAGPGRGRRARRGELPHTHGRPTRARVTETP